MVNGIQSGFLDKTVNLLNGSLIDGGCFKANDLRIYSQEFPIFVDNCQNPIPPNRWLSEPIEDCLGAYYYACRIAVNDDIDYSNKCE
jgi:hypothetical protein